MSFIDRLFGSAPPPRPSSSATPPQVVWPASLTIDLADPKKKMRTAYAAALLSDLVYDRNEVRVRQTLKNQGFTDVVLYGWKGGGSTQAIVARKGDVVVVVFRGTQERIDLWVNSMAINPDPDPKLTSRNVVEDTAAYAGSEVHRGFRLARDEIWDPDANEHADRLRAAGLLPLLTVLKKQADKPGTTFLFTGHSLGAALATISAPAASLQTSASSSREFLKVGQVITFGSPSVGNATFVKHYDRRLGAVTLPVEHHTDLVRSLPSVSDQVSKHRTLRLAPANPSAPPSRLDSHLIAFYIDRLRVLAEAEAKAHPEASP
jgi:predicted lipase